MLLLFSENPNKPLLTLKPPVSLVSLEYNSKDPHGLVSGLFSGQVAIWDVRRGPVPVETSLLEASHRDPVHNVLWINSKSAAEFFSSSTDGQVSSNMFTSTLICSFKNNIVDKLRVLIIHKKQLPLSSNEGK